MSYIQQSYLGVIRVIMLNCNTGEYLHHHKDDVRGHKILILF